MINIWTITAVTLPVTLAIATLMAVLVRQGSGGTKTRAVPVRVKEEEWNQ